MRPRRRTPMSAPGRARIAYRRRASPLHAARGTVVAAYCAAIALAALLTEHPLLLASLLATVLAAGAAAGVGPQLLRALRRSAIPLIGLSVLVNLLVSREGLTVFARLGDWGVLGQVNLTLEALVYGAVFALRLLVVGLACLLAVCAADPDQLLGSCRRLSPRVALSATVALRLVPVLAADAGRLAEAQRCRPGARRPQARHPRAARGPEGHRRRCARALPRRRRRAGDARLPVVPAARPARLGARSRHDLAFAASAAAIALLAIGCSLAGAAPFNPYPLVSAPLDPAVARPRARPARARAGPVPRPRRDRAMSILRFENVSYSYPGAAAPALRDVSLAIEPGEFCVVAGLSGSGKSTLLRAACGLVPHFHGGSFGGHRADGRARHPRAHPRGDRGARGHAAARPRDPGGDGERPRRDRLRAGEPRARRRRGRPLGRGNRARARHRRPPGPLHRGALRRRAAARRARGRARGRAGAGAAGRAHLAARPGRRRRADLAAAPPQPGVRHRRGADRAAARALPGGRRPRDRDVRPGRSSATATPPASWRGRPSTSPPCRPPARACSRAPAWRPPPSGVKQARTILRREGLLDDARDGYAERRGRRGRRRLGARRRGRDAAPARRGALPGACAAATPPGRRRCCSCAGVWHELRDGPAILRGVDLRLDGGEAVVLMGRNGAGKSTLLRHAGALMAPTRGRVQLHGELALLLQNPGDLFVHEHVREEAPAAALRELGPRRAGGAQPPRPLGRAAPAPGARGRARGRGQHARRDRPRRAHQGHGPRRQAAPRGLAVGAGAAGSARAGGHPRLRVRRRIRHPRRAAGARAGDRRRADQRGARRRALLHHRIGPHPRRRRRRRARRGGRRAAAGAAALAGRTVARPAPAGPPPPRPASPSWTGSRGPGDELAAGGVRDRAGDARRRLLVVRALPARRRSCSPWSGRSPRWRPSAATPSPRSRTSSRSPRSCWSPAWPSARRPGSPPARSARSPPTCCSGEGPWTPWQMLGWGMVGLLGAALGALAGRRLSPLMIALACAAAAEVFNLLLDFYTWTGTGSHTLAGFGLVLGSALAFDVTHVVASFAFGLAFGAVLLRMLLRVRSRMHVTWSAPAIGVLLVAVAVVPALGRLRRVARWRRRAARRGRRPRASGVSRARPEPRRRLRRRARAVEQRAVHGLGGDRPRRRRPPAAPASARRPLGARRAARRKPARCRAPATSSARSSRCAPAAPRSTRCPAAIRRRGCSPTRAATAPSSTSPT